MFSHRQNIFEVFSRKTDRFATRLKANDPADVAGLVSDKEQVTAQVSDKSAQVDVALQYVTDLYQEHVKSVLTNTALYVEQKYWEKRVVNEPGGVKYRKVSETVPDSVMAALENTKPEPMTRAVVEIGEQGQVVESRSLSETLGFLLMKINDAVCVTSLFQVHDSGCYNFTVPCARGSL